MSGSHTGGAERPSWSRLLHYAAALLLVVGGAAYWWVKPPSLNPMADPQAAEAMALVQTHRALDAPTILQAINDRVKRRAERGLGVRLDQWRVKKEGPNTYLVQVIIREEGTNQWYEREYVWRVNLARRSVEPASLPATDLMPPSSGPVGAPTAGPP